MYSSDCITTVHYFWVYMCFCIRYGGGGNPTYVKFESCKGLWNPSGETCLYRLTETQTQQCIHRSYHAHIDQDPDSALPACQSGPQEARVGDQMCPSLNNKPHRPIKVSGSEGEEMHTQGAQSLNTERSGLEASISFSVEHGKTITHINHGAGV